MKQELLNREGMHETIFNLFDEYVNDNYEEYKGMLESLVEEYAFIVAEETCDSMDKYVHKDNTDIPGCLMDITLNYEWDHEGKRLKDIVKLADEGKLSEDELKDIQEWTKNWFFEAFGTFGLTYNFGEFVANEVYEYEQEEAA